MQNHRDNKWLFLLFLLLRAAAACSFESADFKNIARNGLLVQVPISSRIGLVPFKTIAHRSCVSFSFLHFSLVSLSIKNVVP